MMPNPLLPLSIKSLTFYVMFAMAVKYGYNDERYNVLNLMRQFSRKYPRSLSENGHRSEEKLF